MECAMPEHKKARFHDVHTTCSHGRKLKAEQQRGYVSGKLAARVIELNRIVLVKINQYEWRYFSFLQSAGYY